VSFLNQLKSQAVAAQSRQVSDLQNLDANTEQTELACQTVWYYVQDLAKQLSLIGPVGAKFSLDGKTAWPDMKLVDFRADSRKKMLRDREVFDTITMGWDIVPQVGVPSPAVLSVNFSPELERIEKRLTFGHIAYERKDQRHPEKNTLQAIRFEYTTKARGNLMVTADHDKRVLVFRLANVDGFDISTATWPVDNVDHDLLDELAKRIVAQPHWFV
jgi:hypothetical protein